MLHGSIFIPMKKSTYTITLSKKFPANHPRHGQPTCFRTKFEEREKIHTIRANFQLWKDRFSRIFVGDAVLSIRQWSGNPYHSKQELVADLFISDDIGIQELVFVDGDINKPHIVKYPSPFNPERSLIPVTIYDLATNDGLSVEDWLDWFKKYDLTKPMAVIHFTGHRYA